MIALIRQSIERGIDFFDTAEAYGPFANEVMGGEALKPLRDQVLIATKLGWNIDPDTGVPHNGVNSKPDHTWAAVEGSLRRLKTDPVPAPRRSRGANGGRRRNREGADPGGKVRHFGCPRRERALSAVPTRCNRSLRSKASTRCGSVGQQSGVSAVWPVCRQSEPECRGNGKVMTWSSIRRWQITESFI